MLLFLLLADVFVDVIIFDGVVLFISINELYFGPVAISGRIVPQIGARRISLFLFNIFFSLRLGILRLVIMKAASDWHGERPRKSTDTSAW